MTELIPLSYLKEECFLSENIDARKYLSHLDEAQEDLKDVIGSEFYDEIESQFNTNPKTLTSANSDLYEGYIRKFLAWQTYFYYLGFANSNSTPSGEREFKDESSDILSDVKMYSKEKNIKRKADRWKQRMINFLRTEQANDSDAYPLYEYSCKDQMSFSITAVDKNSDALIRVNKSIINNE